MLCITPLMTSAGQSDYFDVNTKLQLKGLCAKESVPCTLSPKHSKKKKVKKEKILSKANSAS